MTGPALPRRHDVIGVPVSAVTYDEVLELVMEAARARRSLTVTHLAVHGVVEGSRDLELRRQLAGLDVVAPDGMPVRLALNLLYGAGLPDRVYGPELMLRVCRRAAREGVGVFLYGSREEVVRRLAARVTDRVPGLIVAGAEPSVFRPLTDDEDDALVRRIHDSGAGVVFVGLGCPLQERFVYRHRDRIRAAQIAVGAAFDFHAGTKRMAPRWMQRSSLEWLYRLLQEPRRLWRRYLVTNTIFLVRVVGQALSGRRASTGREAGRGGCGG